MGRMQTSSSSWQISISRWLPLRGSERLAVVGVGNEQRRDDAAGIMAARRLSHIQFDQNILILEAGIAPENATAALRRFAPARVLLVDAAEMEEPAGTIRWEEMSEIAGMSASTHSLPLSMLADYLRLELGCEVALLGIQPAYNDYGEGVSEEVERAVGEIIEEIT